MTARTRILAVQVLAVIAGLVAWEICAQAGWINLRWFSAPSLISARLARDLSSGSLLPDIWITLYETIVGFAIGVVGGIAFGILLGYMPRLRAVMMPYLEAFYGIPRPALAPVFILWFGVGVLSKIVLIFSLVYFVVLVYVIAGFQDVSRDHIRLASTIGATRVQILFKIVVPSVLPSIFAGAKLGMGLAIVGAVVGEFISSDAGLGHYILQASFRGDTVGIYVGLVGLGVISVLFVAAMEVLDRRLFSWRSVVQY